MLNHEEPSQISGDPKLSPKKTLFTRRNFLSLLGYGLAATAIGEGIHLLGLGTDASAVSKYITNSPIGAGESASGILLKTSTETPDPTATQKTEPTKEPPPPTKEAQGPDINFYNVAGINLATQEVSGGPKYPIMMVYMTTKGEVIGGPPAVPQSVTDTTNSNFADAVANNPVFLNFESAIWTYKTTALSFIPTDLDDQGNVTGMYPKRPFMLMHSGYMMATGEPLPAEPLAFKIRQPDGPDGVIAPIADSIKKAVANFYGGEVYMIQGKTPEELQKVTMYGFPGSLSSITDTRGLNVVRGTITQIARFPDAWMSYYDQYGYDLYPFLKEQGNNIGKGWDQVTPDSKLVTVATCVGATDVGSYNYSAGRIVVCFTPLQSATNFDAFS